MLTQLSIKEGMGKFWDIGNNTLLKELNQSHDQNGTTAHEERRTIL